MTINCHHKCLIWVNTLTTQITKYIPMIKLAETIVRLGSKKCEDNKNSIFQLNHLYNSLLMSIFDTPEKDVSKVDRKLDKLKIGTSSIN